MLSSTPAQQPTGLPSQQLHPILQTLAQPGGTQANLSMSHQALQGSAPGQQPPVVTVLQLQPTSGPGMVGQQANGTSMVAPQQQVQQVITAHSGLGQTATHLPSSILSSLQQQGGNQPQHATTVIAQPAGGGAGQGYLLHLQPGPGGQLPTTLLLHLQPQDPSQPSSGLTAHVQATGGQMQGSNAVLSSLSTFGPSAGDKDGPEMSYRRGGKPFQKQHPTSQAIRDLVSFPEALKLWQHGVDGPSIRMRERDKSWRKGNEDLKKRVSELRMYIKLINVKRWRDNTSWEVAAAALQKEADEIIQRTRSMVTKLSGRFKLLETRYAPELAIVRAMADDVESCPAAAAHRLQASALAESSEMLQKPLKCLITSLGGTDQRGSNGSGSRQQGSPTGLSSMPSNSVLQVPGNSMSIGGPGGHTVTYQVHQPAQAAQQYTMFTGMDASSHNLIYTTSDPISAPQQHGGNIVYTTTDPSSAAQQHASVMFATPDPNAPGNLMYTMTDPSSGPSQHTNVVYAQHPGTQQQQHVVVHPQQQQQQHTVYITENGQPAFLQQATDAGRPAQHVIYQMENGQAIQANGFFAPQQQQAQQQQTQQHYVQVHTMPQQGEQHLQLQTVQGQLGEQLQVVQVQHVSPSHQEQQSVSYVSSGGPKAEPQQQHVTTHVIDAGQAILQHSGRSQDVTQPAPVMVSLSSPAADPPPQLVQQALVCMVKARVSDGEPYAAAVANTVSKLPDGLQQQVLSIVGATSFSPDLSKAGSPPTDGFTTWMGQKAKELGLADALEQMIPFTAQLQQIWQTQPEDTRMMWDMYAAIINTKECRAVSDSNSNGQPQQQHVVEVVALGALAEGSAEVVQGVQGLAAPAEIKQEECGTGSSGVPHGDGQVVDDGDDDAVRAAKRPKV